MEYCENCFWESNEICDYIKNSGIKQSSSFFCDTCQNDSEYLIDGDILKYKIQHIIREIYEPESTHGLIGSYSMYDKESSSEPADVVGAQDLHEVCFNLFNIESTIFLNLISEDNHTDNEEFYDPYEQTWIDMRCDWEGGEYYDFKWDDFCKTVKYQKRYFTDFTKTLNKLDNVFEKLITIYSSTVFRARVIRNPESEAKIESNPEGELGVAPKRNAGYNRFSAAGITYIYFAGDKETACLEIRAEKSADIAIAKFNLNEVKLIDLRIKSIEEIALNHFNDGFSGDVRATYPYLEAFIKDITKPIHEGDKLIDYVPTQIVSEYICVKGYDGLIFDSSLTAGYNIVLFDDKYQFESWQKVQYN